MLLTRYKVLEKIQYGTAVAELSDSHVEYLRHFLSELSLQVPHVGDDDLHLRYSSVDERVEGDDVLSFYQLEFKYEEEVMGC